MPDPQEIVDKAIKGHVKAYHATKGRYVYPEDFLAFWKKFKGRWNVEKGFYVKGGKRLACAEWKELSDEDKVQALAVAHRVGDKFTQDACRWLREGKFDDYAVR